jgi:hypothetical protein
MEKSGIELNKFNTIFVKVGDSYVMKLSQYRRALIKTLGGEGATYDTLTPY